jgi:hypothetical protein
VYELLNNWKVVLISLGGAATFWFFNALNKDYNAVINYPVEFQFARDSVLIMKPLPSTVTIDVSSGGWNLIRSTLFFNVTPIQIELENPTEISFFTRSSLFPMVIDQLEGLEVNYMVSDTLYIDIEKKKRKRVIPKIDSLAVSLENGYRITSAINIKPDTIELIGPESFIDSLDIYYVLRLEDKELDDPFRKSVDVFNPNKSLIKTNPDHLDVSFDVEKFERIVLMLDVEAVNFPADSSKYLKQSEVTVSFTVPRSKKEDFKASDFAITADLAMLNKRDSSIIAILIYYPEQAIEVEVSPENVKIGYGK